MSLVRPKLNEIPLVDTFPLSRGSCSITIDIGGWDNLIEAAYNNGFFLIEMDENENPVRSLLPTTYYLGDVDEIYES